MSRSESADDSDGEVRVMYIYIYIYLLGSCVTIRALMPRRVAPSQDNWKCVRKGYPRVPYEEYEHVVCARLSRGLTSVGWRVCVRLYVRVSVCARCLRLVLSQVAVHCYSPIIQYMGALHS